VLPPGSSNGVAGHITVGTSSWADPGFVEEWYPRGLPARDRLAWYAERFEAVEVNSSFYALPDARTVERWAAVTPAGFTFDVKLHRVLSHHAAPPESLPPELRGLAPVTRRGRVELTEPLQEEMVAHTLAAVEPLAEAGKLSALLLQLSPSFAPPEQGDAEAQLDRLAPVVDGLRPHRVAVELRHRAWVHEDRLRETLSWLDDHEAAFVCVDAPQGTALTMMPPVDAVTRDDLAYFRLHGRNASGYVSGKTVAERFGHVYCDNELGEVRERVASLAGQARDVRTMFNNNRGNDAPAAARRMRELLGQDPGPEPERGPAAPSGEQQLSIEGMG
jgi:uncharacterized protein YecE (DUF72 family)